MRFNKFLPKILLIFGILALILIIKYQNSVKETFSYNLEKLRIHLDNFFYQTNSEPKRQPPISLLQKETELKLYIGEPFRDFDRNEWNEFWSFVYGAFPKERPKREGLPNKLRQLTLDEIASALISRYPDPFSYFKENHWKLFFDIILKK